MGANPRGPSPESWQVFRKLMVRVDKTNPRLCPWWVAFSVRMLFSFTPLVRERAKRADISRNLFELMWLGLTVYW